MTDLGLELIDGPEPDPGAKTVAVVAHWSPDGSLSRSVRTLAKELRDNGFSVVLVSTAPREGLAENAHLVRGATVCSRPNIGYDFGSWAAVMRRYPWVCGVDRLLLVNDSLVGPFGTLRPILAGFADCRSDVWGLISTAQDRPHLQSCFVGYRRGVVASSPGLSKFWQGVRPQPLKRTLIEEYEVGLADVLLAGGNTWQAEFHGRWVVHDGQNPTILGWRRLLNRGFPFVKREIVIAPPVELLDADEIPAVVRKRFGSDVREWV